MFRGRRYVRWNVSFAFGQAAWADHCIFRHTHGRKTIHHELVGDLHLHYQSLIVPQDPDQYVVLYTTPPGSAAASLAELATRSEPASFPASP